MNCENCSWYVDREKTVQESQFLQRNPMMMIDTRFCALGNCDGSMFIDKNRQAEKESSETETWNGIHAQITAPKGTFEKIWNNATGEQE